MTERMVFRASEGPIHQVRPDFAGLVIAGRDSTLVRWDIPAGGVPTAPLHSHADHEQFCVVLDGAIEMVIEGEPIRLDAGDICRVDPNIRHGRTRALNGKSAVVLDIYAPPRPEYVEVLKSKPVR